MEYETVSVKGNEPAARTALTDTKTNGGGVGTAVGIRAQRARVPQGSPDGKGEDQRNQSHWIQYRRSATVKLGMELQLQRTN
uniref:Uncharacterized protein n=1 Tax=Oryza barthii TaxID=65489 RepID=A0A0D3GYX1_9ORYZ